MAENVTGGEGRKDEVGRSGIYPATEPYPNDAEVITPAEINRGGHREGPGVERNEQEDETENDALGG